jgi:hypothetical protein
MLWLDDDLTFEDLDPVHTWRTDLERAERAGQTDVAERLRAEGPPPGYGESPRKFAPLIVSVEVGSDPGGVIAVALAARHVPLLSLVIVIGGQDAARFTRHLLDLMDRPEVIVVASNAPSTQDSSMMSLTPPQTPEQSADVAGAIRAVTAQTPHLLLWASYGPLTDLAQALANDPGLSDRLAASIGAGPLDAATPQFASDPTSAAMAIAALRKPSVESHDPRAAVRPSHPPDLLTADLDEVTITAGAPLHQLLTASDSERWHHLLGHHLNQWFAQGHVTSSQAASLSVASIMQSPFIESERRSIAVDSTGRIQIDSHGVPMDTTLSTRRWGEVFTEWLTVALGGAVPPPDGDDSSDPHQDA